ncbi:transposase [Streptomyces sp. NPDC056690]|uniref:transposase n=1 Tax=unclassified Streptomyces TaxID=2593676 RepID=UPI00363BB643
MDFPRSGDGFRRYSTPHDPVTRLRFQGVGHVKGNQHRAVIGKVKTVSAKREGRKWFLVLSAELPRPEPLPATGSVVGIDLGVASFLATSNGEHVPNPRHARKAAARPRTAAVTTSGRWRRPRRCTAECSQRPDHAHKTVLCLVREHDFIAHEDPEIGNMRKSPAPKPDPGQPGGFLPNRAASKAGLNRSISC